MMRACPADFARLAGYLGFSCDDESWVKLRNPLTLAHWTMPVVELLMLVGAALGAVVVNWAKTLFTSGFMAPYWLFALGGLFVVVTLFLPKGILGTAEALWARRRKPDSTPAAEPAPAE